MACIGFKIYLQYIFSLVLFFYYNISADWNWIFYDMDLTLEIKESEEFIDSNIWKLEFQKITEQVIVKSETRTEYIFLCLWEKQSMSTKWNQRGKWDVEHKQNKLKFLREKNKQKTEIISELLVTNNIKTYKKLWTWKMKVLSKRKICRNYPMKTLSWGPNQWKRRFKRTIICFSNH